MGSFRPLMDPSLWELPTPVRVLKMNVKVSDLPLMKRIIFRLYGKVYLEHRQLKGWRRPLPFYLVICPVHGPFEDYPHEYYSEARCPKCYGYTPV